LVNDLEKQLVKKKIKNYEKVITVEAKHKRQTQQEMNELQRDMKYQVDEEKADTESKIAMKKDAIQSSNESIQLYEMKKHRGTQRGHGSKTGGHKGDIGILKGDVKGTYTKKRGLKGDI
jgi:hypothetical protein